MVIVVSRTAPDCATYYLSPRMSPSLAPRIVDVVYVSYFLFSNATTDNHWVRGSHSSCKTGRAVGSHVRIPWTSQTNNVKPDLLHPVKIAQRKVCQGLDASSTETAVLKIRGRPTDAASLLDPLSTSWLFLSSEVCPRPRRFSLE